MKRCSCGAEGLSDGTIICPQCGRFVDDRAPSPAPEQVAPPVVPSIAAPSFHPVCRHEVEEGYERCRHCHGGSPVRAAGIDTPWGVVVVPEEGLHLGRDASFSPSVPNLARCDNVSGRHAIVRRAPGGVWVEDLHSTNGTFVDGLKLTPGERHLAPLGSEIRLASDPPVVIRVVPS